MLSRNRLCLLDGKNHYKSPTRLFDLNCFDSMLYTIGFRALVLRFSIWVAEVFQKKFFTSCCSVFHRFYLVLPFLSFANLKLVFSLKKLFGNQENSSPCWKSLFPVEVNYFNRDTNLSNQLMMSYVWREFSSVRWMVMKEDLGVSNAQAWGCPCAPPINIQGESSI